MPLLLLLPLLWTSVAVRLEESAVTSLGTATATVETVRVGVDATVVAAAAEVTALLASSTSAALWWFSLCRLRERASQ